MTETKDVKPLEERTNLSVAEVKPPAARLYGRQKGRPLRQRQHLLLEKALPRMRLSLQDASNLAAVFDEVPEQIWMEVGFGGGEHVIAQTAAHSRVGYIASEVFENGLCSLLSRLFPEGGEETAPVPPMLRLWDDDARLLLEKLPDASLDRLFLMFPDPWPKARHAKRRFVHPGNLPLVARVLKPGAEWRIASDDPIYQAWVYEVMTAQSFFAIAASDTIRPSDWPPTRYEAKAVKAGRKPVYWRFIRH
ncbi:tRNA (guanosine(46)-N7)-methyltransferase TrmB [Acetobacter musti]|uniref:tRNA (guanine-N(7)-)-methyltransferase n=1 Tax=Acetobacter musti TaxID=864732 RepID=A0ABX0JVG6_9PROT|nr:tRNA (guanine(46)-N(7))-methyltransferase TrmB [Acetobacter musti]NHN85970.1 tRNA (guanosine(46)-N7)-methyltransferase TrmB [Acetobacter musti]